jgi:hypothetical protein
MENTLQALMVKKFKDAEMNLDVGRHWVDETVVIQVSGTVERHEDQWIAPTISIPLIPTIAFFWERLGIQKDTAMGVLREAITEAMRAGSNGSSAPATAHRRNSGTNRPRTSGSWCSRDSPWSSSRTGR